MKRDRGPEHYSGIVAETYDRGFGRPPRDEAFFRDLIADGGEPALEVACGTGRLLLPYLKADLDVEGLDASAEMLDLCREKARADDLDPVLHEGRMEALDLPRRYRTIYVPYGSFQVLVDFDEVHAALEGFRAHLEPEGRLVLALFVPRRELDELRRWRIRRVAEPGEGVTVFVHEAVDYDRTEQVQTDEYRYEVVENGVVVHVEARSMHQRWYGKHEFALRLERAGLAFEWARGDYTDEPFADRHKEMVVSARRPR